LALKLYERNTALSEALYGVVQGFEVCFRNRLDSLLSAAHGLAWFRTVPLRFSQREAIAEAERKLTKNQETVAPARMVSQLTLGFWVALIGGAYEKILWVPHLHLAFPNAVQYHPLSTGERKLVKIPRRDIARRADTIKTLRNRIAHHEAILQISTERTYCEIIEAIHWLCPTTAAWVGQTNCFAERFNRAVK
jgi:hypothetical protein